MKSQTSRPPQLPDIYLKLAPTLTAKLLGVTERTRERFDDPAAHPSMTPRAKLLVPLMQGCAHYWGRPAFDSLVAILGAVTCPETAGELKAALAQCPPPTAPTVDPGAVVVPLNNQVNHNFSLGQAMVATCPSATPMPVDYNGRYSGCQIGHRTTPVNVAPGSAATVNWRFATNEEIEQFVKDLTVTGWRYITRNAHLQTMLES